MKDNKLANPTLQQDFDASRYLGDWYELYRSKNIRFERGSDIIARYASDPKHPERIAITNLQTLESGKIDTITGYAVRRNEEGPASDLAIRFNFFLRGKYQILRTDYETFSIVYSSRTLLFGLLKKEYCWILARKRESRQDSDLMDGLFKTIEDETGMTRDEFVETHFLTNETANSSENQQ